MYIIAYTQKTILEAIIKKVSDARLHFLVKPMTDDVEYNHHLPEEPKEI